MGGRGTRLVNPIEVCAEYGHEAGLAWTVSHCAEMLGVAPSTLRTWERRYGLSPSQRSEGGPRRYTCEDVDRLELMRRLLAAGLTASAAAHHARDFNVQDIHDEARALDLIGIDRHI